MGLNSGISIAKRKVLTTFKTTLQSLKSVGNETEIISFLSRQIVILLPHIRHAIDLQIPTCETDEQKQRILLEKRFIDELEKVMRSYLTKREGSERNECYENILTKIDSILYMFGGELHEYDRRNNS